MTDSQESLSLTKEKQFEALWDGLTQFGSAHSDDALHFMLESLARLLDSQQAYWLGSVRLLDKGRNDPLHGWRPREVHYLHEQPERRAKFEKHVRHFEQQAKPQIDPSVSITLRHAGEFRVNTHRQMLPDSWYQSEHYITHYAAYGITDTMLVTLPINEDVESWIGIQRIDHDTPYYSEAECQLAARAVRPLRWFHQQLALNHGLLLADKPLSPSERRVLNALLSEATEAKIAEQLHLTPSTVHTYSKRIYRKYGVRGRTGLTALWLGK